MTAIVATSSIVPVHASASLRSEQVTQLVYGEGADVLERSNGMIRLKTRLDDYEGWTDPGYFREADANTVDAWLSNAAWSLGASVEVAGGILRLPHRARVTLEGTARVRLPDGRPAQIVSGTVLPYHQFIQTNLAVAPAEWAWREFGLTPYLWGGVSDSGIDCSALVQTTFLARGIRLPRDSGEQSAVGELVSNGQFEAGDLLFFHGENTDSITHVAMASDSSSIVHSTVATGCVTRESSKPGSRAAEMMTRLRVIRRLS